MNKLGASMKALKVAEESFAQEQPEKTSAKLADATRNLHHDLSKTKPHIDFAAG